MPIKSKRSARSNSNRAAELPQAPRAKKTCYFCDNEVAPTYTDTVVLKKFISDRAKIVARGRNGLCSKHQRQVSAAIKHARHLSLLPFIARV